MSKYIFLLEYRVVKSMQNNESMADFKHFKKNTSISTGNGGISITVAQAVISKV